MLTKMFLNVIQCRHSFLANSHRRKGETKCLTLAPVSHDSVNNPRTQKHADLNVTNVLLQIYQT